MSDETAASQEGQAAPESASPEGTGAATPETLQIPEGYMPEKDYKELQSWATKVAQENKEHQELTQALRDPENPRFEEAVGYFGLQVPQPEEQEQEYVDPYDQRIAKLEADLQQQRQAQESASQQAAIDNALYEGLSQIQGQIGRELREEEIDLLAAHALMNAGEDGLPNVESAWKLYHSLVDQEKGAVFQNRKNAPKPSPSGVEAGKQVDLSTRQARAERIQELWAASQESEAV